MRQHQFEKHTDCRLNYCPICDGGLYFCTVCRLGEGELTTECPGPLSVEEREIRLRAFSLGKVDFINGEWKNL